jgi:hypothetical protein
MTKKPDLPKSSGGGGFQGGDEVAWHSAHYPGCIILRNGIGFQIATFLNMQVAVTT